ncbi:MAG: O-linked N-acetylglucosamine transferase, SPINDLY family protein [Pseudanabaenaceae cyanobacterium]
MNPNWRAIAQAHIQAQAFTEALAIAERAAQEFPHDDTWPHLAGFCWEQLQQPERAAAAYRQAIALNPQNGEVWCRLAAVCGSTAVYAEAQMACPDFFGIYLNWGNFELREGNPEAALAIYERGWAATGHPDLQENRAIAQALCQDLPVYYRERTQQAIAQQQWDIAFRAYERYLTHAPALDWTTVQPWWQAVGSQALMWQEAALRRFPEVEALHYEVVIQRLRGGDPEGAIGRAEAALARFPTNYTFRLWSNLLVPTSYNQEAEILFYRQRYIEGLTRLQQETDLTTDTARQEALAAIGRFSNFYLNYQGLDDRPLQAQYGELVHRIVAANFPEWVSPLPPITDKIRVGFLSQFLRSWSGTYLFLGWLQNLDPSRFAVYAYALSPESDGITEQFRACSERFTLLPTDPAAAAQQVRSDRLHVLIFPELGMDPPTLRLAAMRLAPVQCMAWGQPVTSGLPTVDYFLSSETMEPADGDAHYTETLVRLPHIGVFYPYPNLGVPTHTRADFGLRAEAVVYLSSQAPYKYLPQYDDLYAAIAQQVPQAQIVFLRGGIPPNRLARAFAQLGLDWERHCTLLPVLPGAVYFDLLRCCDVYLDTPSWSGGNTSLDAAACGLPMVTWPSPLMRGRHTYGILQRLGLTATVAHSAPTYVAIAARLGQDAAWRQAIAAQTLAGCSQLFGDRECVQALMTFLEAVATGQPVPTRWDETGAISAIAVPGCCDRPQSPNP